MNNESAKQYSSSDFYISAFLMAKGLNLIDIDKANPRRALFIFEDTKDRKNLIEGFNFSKEKVEPKIFIEKIKSLKQLLHSDY